MNFPLSLTTQLFSYRCLFEYDSIKTQQLKNVHRAMSPILHAWQFQSSFFEKNLNLTIPRTQHSYLAPLCH
jgi:hypothetical protein